MLVGKIIYLVFASLMALINIFWFIQKLSQQKIFNYIMGALGLIKIICIVAYFCGAKVLKILIYPLGGISKFSISYNISIWREFLILIFSGIYHAPFL